MSRTQLTTLVALIAAGACGPFGTRAANFGPVQSAEGATVHIQLRTGAADGELLAVSDTGILIFQRGAEAPRPGRLTLVRYSAIAGLVEGHFGAQYRSDGKAPDVATRKRLSLVSRFPQGLSPEITLRLLAMAGQSGMDVVP